MPTPSSVIAGRALEDAASDAALVQVQREAQAADARADDDHVVHPDPGNEGLSLSYSTSAAWSARRDRSPRISVT